MRQNFSTLDIWESDGTTHHGNGEIREWKWFCLILTGKTAYLLVKVSYFRSFGYCFILLLFFGGVLFYKDRLSVLYEPKNLLSQLPVTSCLLLLICFLPVQFISFCKLFLYCVNLHSLILKTIVVCIS